MTLKHVLLADDDRIIREAVGTFLREQGYLVQLAADGLEALEAVRAAPPEVLLLDLVMPKVDGGRVSRYLRADPRWEHIPIIVVSSLAARDIVHLEELEADAYVAKGPFPILTQNILAALQHLDQRGRAAPLAEAIFGYEGFRPRRLTSELLSLGRHVNILRRKMSEGVLETDRDGRIVAVNPAALRMLEASEPGLIGAKLWEVVGPTHRAAVAQLAEALRTGATDESQALTLELKGALRRASFTPVREDHVFAGLLVLLETLGPPPGPQPP